MSDSAAPPTTSTTSTEALPSSTSTTGSSRSAGVTFKVAAHDAVAVTEVGLKCRANALVSAVPRPAPPFAELETKWLAGSVFEEQLPNLRVARFRNWTSNSFVTSISAAYNIHHNLILRPDDVWLAVMNQLSLYVGGHSEELRPLFVAHQGQKELVVSSGGSLRSANYEALCNRMATTIGANLVDSSVASWVVPDFTTTTPTDRVVGSATLMSAMQKYFTFKYHLCCGIPEVTLLGTPTDWYSLRSRSERLQQYGLGRFSEVLRPVMDNFIASSEGRPDINWWQTVCDVHGGGSGPRYLSGWITAFCRVGETGKWTDEEQIDTTLIPPGFCSCPVTVEDDSSSYETKLYCGHLLEEYSPNKLTVKPRSDWALMLL